MMKAAEGRWKKIDGNMHKQRIDWKENEQTTRMNKK